MNAKLWPNGSLFSSGNGLSRHLLESLARAIVPQAHELKTWAEPTHELKKFLKKIFWLFFVHNILWAHGVANFRKLELSKNLPLSSGSFRDRPKNEAKPSMGRTLTSQAHG